jgi:hypothetical protein
MNSQIISSGFGVLGTLGGTLIGLLANRQARRMLRLERRVKRYRSDIRARQSEENIAACWIVELGGAGSLQVAKRKLRERTEQETGLRPFIEPSEVKSHD